MPRQARHIDPGVPLHVVQRGANRQQCFRAESDFQRYWQLLQHHAQVAKCDIHAYVLMSNHVHLLVTPSTGDAVSETMKAVGQKYAQFFNHRYRRTGPLWENRYRAHIVQDDAHLITCQRYIELNPVRAGMCESPVAYRWSSHRSNAEGAPDAAVTPHVLYLSLGTRPLERRANYRGLFNVQLGQADLDAIRAATISGSAFGSHSYATSIARRRGLPP